MARRVRLQREADYEWWYQRGPKEGQLRKRRGRLDPMIHITYSLRSEDGERMRTGLFADAERATAYATQRGWQVMTDEEEMCA
jgi:hypothetical protein